MTMGCDEMEERRKFEDDEMSGDDDDEVYHDIDGRYADDDDDEVYHDVDGRYADDDDDDVVPCDNYDGTISVEAFLVHFQAVSDINGWSEEENFSRLMAALEGPVVHVLSGKQDLTFESLCDELREGFGV